MCCLVAFGTKHTYVRVNCWGRLCRSLVCLCVIGGNLGINKKEGESNNRLYKINTHIKTSPARGFLFYPNAGASRRFFSQGGPARQGVNESQHKQGGASRKPFQTCQTAGAHKPRRDRPGDRRHHKSGPLHQINIFLLFPYWHHTKPQKKVNKNSQPAARIKNPQKSAFFAPIFQICPYFLKFAPSVDASKPAEI